MNWRSILITAIFCGLNFAGAHPINAGCVSAVLVDANGQVIMPGGLVVGMLLGGSIITGHDEPPHYEKKQLDEADCPQQLVDYIRALYNNSCPTTQRRIQAATANNTTLDVIRKGCGEMESALNSLG